MGLYSDRTECTKCGKIISINRSGICRDCRSEPCLFCKKPTIRKGQVCKKCEHAPSKEQRELLN